MHKVTVIVPNYNHQYFLQKRIESILQQTYKDFEVILMDDCSTDNSRTILDSYRNHSKVSKIIYNEINSGSTFIQWQKGIREAKGEYIWIAESDDYADESMLETLVKQLDAHPSVGLAYCQSWSVDERDTIISSCKKLYGSIPCNQVCVGKEVLTKYMIGANLIPNASAVVFRREIALSIDNYFTHFIFSGDWWFWCEILLKSDIIHICAELNYFRVHEHKVTVSSVKKGLYFTEALKIINLIKQNIDIPEKVYNNKSKNLANLFVKRQLGESLHNKLSPSTAFGVLVESFRLNKVFLKRVVLLMIKEKLHLFTRYKSI